MKKILTIIGARPQFIKASVVSKAILENDNLQEIIVHTGQHFDKNMSDIFFEQLSIPRPHYLLDINGGSHGDMTGRMLIEIEKVLLNERPDCVLVYGDTNSTLAGALAAAKLHIPVAHVEAGLRSFNMNMPEEVNRILTDRVSNILFCPTETAISNLNNEGYPFITSNGFKQKITNVGDVMQDSALLFSRQAVAPRNAKLPNRFILATIHRAENTNDLERLSNILEALNDISKNISIILPIHPRTLNIINRNKFDTNNILFIDPVGYFEMLWLLKNSELVVTDSGGVQKEAFFMEKACITMRDQTEWIELVNLGVNELVGANKEKILDAVNRNIGRKVIDTNQLYGGGEASKRIVVELEKYL
ncbi:UDP-N-acetylglucosamine 2-epimerase (non-hydrolyzing) [[Pasteurella] aerogenes]|nr:UDP-N-acetylglucosamine 2-epimerase (non-hydrolyzing) [[Pasteurella] aerogenes]